MKVIMRNTIARTAAILAKCSDEIVAVKHIAVNWRLLASILARQNCFCQNEWMERQK